MELEHPIVWNGGMTGYMFGRMGMGDITSEWGGGIDWVGCKWERMGCVEWTGWVGES